MLITKVNPVGIDAVIQKLQKHLHDRLIQLWDLTGNEDKYVSYGRCYRNRKADGYIAEVYVGGNEYRDAYFDDKLFASSFFGTGSKESHNTGETVDIHLVFFVNLKKLKPLIAHRADEEVRKDVQNLIGKNLFGCEYVSTELWLENCLREYPGTLRNLQLNRGDGSEKFDMHPQHCFRINLQCRYSKNIC